MPLLIVSETMEAVAASPFHWERGWFSKAPTLDPFLGSRRGLSLQKAPGRAGKGVSVMYLDRPCPITTSNITSFNLYNGTIDPSGCYPAAIAAQVWAQLSFGGLFESSL